MNKTREGHSQVPKARQINVTCLMENLRCLRLCIFERQSTSRGGAESEGDAESEAGSRLWAVSTESDTGLKLTSCEIMTWAEVGRSTEPPRSLLMENLKWKYTQLGLRTEDSVRPLPPSLKTFKRIRNEECKEIGNLLDSINIRLEETGVNWWPRRQTNGKQWSWTKEKEELTNVRIDLGN